MIKLWWEHEYEKLEKKYLEKQESNLARGVGYGKGYLGKVERGEVLISMKATLNIVAATQADIGFIMFGKVTQKLTKKRKRLLKIIETCSAEEIDDYFDYVCKQRYYRFKIANDYKYLSQQVIRKYMDKQKKEEIAI